jgi:hypothetical protein
MNHRVIGVLCMLTATATATAPGCGDAESGAKTDDGTKGSLSNGARGPAVREAQEYLTRFGYFPNAELAARFAGWRPMVTRAPAAADVFDDNLETALRKFQVVAGLPVTGVLDPATVAMMRQPRCGHPDADPAGPPLVDKFSIRGPSKRWTPGSTIRVKFAEPNVALLQGSSPTATQATIMAALVAWHQAMDLNFSFVNPTDPAEVTITYNQEGVNVGGHADSPPSPVLNITRTPLVQRDPSQPVAFGEWSQFGDSDPNHLSLFNVAMHEGGHLLGLDHSSVGATSSLLRPVMNFSTNNRTTLDDDDRMAINVAYNGWENVGGLGKDIGANISKSTLGEAVWILGNDDVPWRFNGSGWDQIPGIIGTRIDVDNDGRAWVVDMNKRIFRYVPSANPVWQEVPGNGAALDIGIGSNIQGNTSFPGSVFVIGTDKKVYGFNFNTNGWAHFPGPTNVVAIDVDSSGMPSVVTAGGQVMDFKGGSTWTTMPGTNQSLDIGFGGRSNGLDIRRYLWMVRQDQVVGIRELQAQQTASVNGVLEVVASGHDEFVPTNGLGTRVTAGVRGRPWVIASNKTIWRRLELP